jgi:hypothetical protein
MLYACYGFTTQPDLLTFHGEMASIVYNVNVSRSLVIDLLAVPLPGLSNIRFRNTLGNLRDIGSQKMQPTSFLIRNVFEISQRLKTFGFW